MTIDLFPAFILDDDLTPDAFGPEIDDAVNEVVDACAGWGANSKKVIEIMGSMDATQRYQMQRRYLELHSDAKQKTLDKLMKKEFSGDFGQALRFLSLSPVEAECAMIKAAAKGVGAQVNVIYSIICGRTNRELELLKKKYFEIYTKDLGKLMASELHGDMERLIFNCLQAAEQEYDPQFHTADKAMEDAAEIHDKGQGRWGTDEKGIFKLLCASPPQYLEMVNQTYADKYGYTLMKAMEKELGGNVRSSCLHMIGMKLKPYETVAKLIKSACAGIGTDELLLTTCVIRYQHILAQVMAAHVELFNKTVQDRVREETGGNYKSLLLMVLNTAFPEY
uniref:Annexin n=1 Tax=Grammatophora oceanica TaxID=210454 RepID=A0A7S1Y2C7_9STRA|eukprot:CAMPEP_0194047504 /NCGR_PEP_ID=MMETSP0009_2-20130614/25006_1 /TAXON_ID=210454 /ORGANISM="Grammatophora oceanica, Strain CCMP 410" /LENGTH=335 /DNA_ID=CAMNT_0038693153 /DNA_START=60 /DNA_END=1067 /DNA_ORIENTATION=-